MYNRVCGLGFQFKGLGTILKKVLGHALYMYINPLGIVFRGLNDSNRVWVSLSPLTATQLMLQRFRVRGSGFRAYIVVRP